VISGFLITGQLARELERTGRIALPASGQASAAAAAGILHRALLQPAGDPLHPSALDLLDSLREILASTFYVENWSLAASSVDYWRRTTPRWPALLVARRGGAVYIVWPLLLLGATWLGARFFTRRRWLPMIAVVVLVTWSRS